MIMYVSEASCKAITVLNKTVVMRYSAFKRMVFAKAFRIVRVIYLVLNQLRTKSFYESKRRVCIPSFRYTGSGR